MQLKRFKELKNLVTELVLTIDKQIIIVTDHEWILIDQIIEILVHPFILTAKLQSTKYTIADFYADWVRFDMVLRKNTYSFYLPHTLRAAMNKWQPVFTKNDCVLGTIYLSRYQALLNDEEKQAAITYLITLSSMLEKMKNNPFTNNNSINGAPAPAHSDESEDEFEEMLYNKEQETSNISRDILNAITSYKPERRLEESTKTSTLEYWKILKYKYPLLYEMACVLNGVPATQTSVESNFSALSYVFNKFRTQLSAKTLENILLLRVNKFL